jgi:hypothetical protein
MRSFRPWFSIRRFAILLGILVLGALIAFRFLPPSDPTPQVAPPSNHRINKQKPISAPETRDPIEDLLTYFHNHGIVLEKDEHMSFWWTVTWPAGGDFRVAVALKSFPLSENEQQMREELLPISLAYILNAPAHLAMSYPGLRGTTPNSAIQSPGDEATMKKLQDLFECYRPSNLQASRAFGNRHGK